MTESRLRSLVGVFWIIAQIAVMAFAVVRYVQGYLLYDDLTTAVALILPMFAVHAAAIAKYFSAHRTPVRRRTPEVTGTFAFLALLIPALFAIAISSILYVKSRGMAFGASEQFKYSLGLVESVFAIFLGTFLGSLFDEKADHASQQHTTNLTDHPAHESPQTGDQDHISN